MVRLDPALTDGDVSEKVDHKAGVPPPARARGGIFCLGENFHFGIDNLVVAKAQEREDQHQDSEEEARDHRPKGDDGKDRERVGSQQRAAQHRALEHGLDLRGEGLVGRIRDSLRTQLGVSESSTNLTEVHRNEVVGVDLSLLPGKEFLSGVRGEEWLDEWIRDLSGALRWEVDLLSGHLSVDRRGCKTVAPCQESARAQQRDCEERTAPRK